MNETEDNKRKKKSKNENRFFKKSHFGKKFLMCHNQATEEYQGDPHSTQTNKNQ